MSELSTASGRLRNTSVWWRALGAVVTGVCILGTVTSCVVPDPQPPKPPPGYQCQRASFEQAVIEQSSDPGPPRWHLTVSGRYSGFSPSLAPYTYVRQPEYWAIEVRVCTTSGANFPGPVSRYVLTIDLTGITGSKGVALNGSQSHRLEVPPPPTAPKTLLEGTSWEMNGSQIGETPVPVSRTVTAGFSATEVSGTAPCNTYQAPYRTLGRRITLGPIVTTKIGCDPDVAAAEAAFIARLGSITEFRLDYLAEGLTLIGVPGQELPFRRVT